MTWSETIPFAEPLRDVRLRCANRADDLATLLQEEGDRAFEAGLRAGERNLGEQLLQQRHEMVAYKNGVLAALERAVAQVIGQAERQLIELVMEVAQKVVGEIPVTLESVEANVRAALAQARESTEIKISVHPDDLRMLQDAQHALLSPADDGRQLLFQSAPDIARGGCLVETRFGIIDATRETRLAAIHKALDS